MATWLYRIGRGAYRRRRLVLMLWLAILAVAGCCLTVLGSNLDNDFTIPGSESQTALDDMAENFPTAAGTSAQIVFTAPEGSTVTDPEQAAAIERTLAAAMEAPQVTAVITPEQAGTVTEDGSTALAQVNYDVSRSDLEDGTLDALEDTTQPAEEAGLEVAVGGQAYGNGVLTAGPLEMIGVLVALAVLGITFGSLLAAGMPLLSAFAGVATSLCGLLALSSGLTVSSTAVSLALMLGLAVGIDYALFILSRYRTQLVYGMDPEESAGSAVATAGSAVVFAGLTVIVALVGLTVVRIPFLTVMGLSAAATVLIAVLVAITLLPALCGFAGRRLVPRPRSRAARRAVIAVAGNAGAAGGAANGVAADAEVSSTTLALTLSVGPKHKARPKHSKHAARTRTRSLRPAMGQRWARMVSAHPLLFIAGVVALLGTCALPATDLRLALPDNGNAAEGTSQREAYDTISEAFGPGYNGPLLLFVEGSAGGEEGQRQAVSVATRLQELPGVVLVSVSQYDAASGQAVIQLVPDSGPQDEATEDLVDTVRDDADDLKKDTGATVSVTGTTAISIDVSERLSASLVPFAAVVVGLCLVLLLLVFRSLVVPLKATVGFLLSVVAAFGAVVAVFQWGWFADALDVASTGPVVSFLPIVLMAVLFGLAMDYEVFLVSSMREEWIRTGNAKRAITAGAGRASRVVTAAALIMFFVFASFVTMEDAIVKPIAFSLAFGVLVDAFAVRMTLVPAVLALVGRSAWWLPRWLDWLLPDLDIEGTKRRESGTDTRTDSVAADNGTDTRTDSVAADNGTDSGTDGKAADTRTYSRTYTGTDGKADSGTNTGADPGTDTAEHTGAETETDTGTNALADTRTDSESADPVESASGRI